MTEHHSRFILPFAFLAAILAVSTSSIFIRFAQADAPSLVIAAIRLIFATILLAPLVWMRHRQELKSLRRNEVLPGILSGLFLAIHFATWTSSLEFTTVASSVVFVSTGPLWVALLSPVFLDERMERAALLGLGVALLGGTVIGLSDACTWDGRLLCPNLGRVLQGDAMWGNFLALAGAWTVSGYLIIGRKLRARISLLPYVFLVYGVAALALILLMLFAGLAPFGYPASTYGWIFLLALFPQLIGHSTYNWVLRYLPATLVAVITLIEPLASATLAFLILRESPTPGILFGGALILAGIYLATRPA